MFFWSAYYTEPGAYPTGPYTGDTNQMYNPATGIPFWMTRSTMSRAICMAVGPFTDPAGTYTVLPDQMLVMFEVKQPPEGTPQPKRKVTYAIFDIDRNFVGSDSQFFRIVDPEALYQPGDDVCLWSSEVHAVRVIGKHRAHSVPTRSNAGSMMINPGTT